MAKRISRGVEFLTDFNKQDDSLEIPADLTTLSSDELTELRTKATDAFNALYQNGEADLSDTDVETLGVLVDGIEALNAEIGVRDAALGERKSTAAELAARAGITLAAEDESDEGGEGSEDESDEDEDHEAPGDGAGEFARKSITVNLSGIRAKQPKAPKPEFEAEKKYTIQDLVTAAPDLPGFANGQGMNFEDMAKGVDQRLKGFNEGAYEAASRANHAMRQEFGVATIKKPFASNLVITSDAPDHVDAVFKAAVDESRLPGGSLVASGGWCAPSEILYDLYEEESRDGLISLPEIGIKRGGIRFTPGPQFSDIFSATGFCFDEPADINGNYGPSGTAGTKPCFHVTCPAFSEQRLQVCGVCITAGLLQQRGYPEVIARTIRGALIGHDHRVAAKVIQAMIAGSTLTTMNSPQAGTVAPILTAIEMQAEHYRYTHRLARATSLEAVFPFWVRGAIRADLARRPGTDLDPLSVTDAQINAWFTLRGISPQFVYNWQDINTIAASGFTQYPQVVSFLMYRAGTWVRGSSDVIDLGTVYDSTNLGKNDYTALFTEEGWLVAKRGHDSRLVTVPFEPTGQVNTFSGSKIAVDGTHN